MTEQSNASHVVVGVDGSPASIEAVRWAARYAGMTGADLEAVTSWEPPTSYGAGLGLGASFDTLDIDWQGMAVTSLNEALVQALPDGHEAVKRSVVCGHPAAALLAAAKGADLLVVGSRGHGGFAGMLLGSVSTHLVAHAPCPVVVVRQPTAPADDPAREPVRP
ncbi:universal stress protein [Lapillicoccus sp.]|uniref:universal stress protein n=1 Tax=Lapillicoccus sp. TaxID=1909287 RepID=UPI003263DC09